jgi:hypothetical protein
MQWLRTIPRFVRVLVALFAVAQFAGVVSSPLSSARGVASPDASQVHDYHAHKHGGADISDHRSDQGGHPADHCCALHAFFAAVLPAAIAVAAVNVTAQRLPAQLTEIGGSIDPGRLDRPPRPLT